MSDIPSFSLYGDGEVQIEVEIQPQLALRGFGELSQSEKQIAFEHLCNLGCVDASKDTLVAILLLNHEFLRVCPGKRVHKSVGADSSLDEHTHRVNAVEDFRDVFVLHETETLVLRMVSQLAQLKIDQRELKRAREASTDEDRQQYIKDAYKKFDRFATHFNHVFKQFAINVVLTRNGIAPIQDPKISEFIYVPTLRLLSDPKWKSVSDDLGLMFDDFANGDNADVITKAHRVVQRFLQISVGEEGKNGSSEMGKLLNEAKTSGLLPKDRFTEPMINVIQSFIVSERATKSNAKPALSNPTDKDALLVMNVVMVLLQHCLSATKE